MPEDATGVVPLYEVVHAMLETTDEVSPLANVPYDGVIVGAESP